MIEGEICCRQLVHDSWQFVDPAPNFDSTPRCCLVRSLDSAAERAAEAKARLIDLGESGRGKASAGSLLPSPFDVFDEVGGTKYQASLLHIRAAITSHCDCCLYDNARFMRFTCGLGMGNTSLHNAQASVNYDSNQCAVYHT